MARSPDDAALESVGLVAHDAISEGAAHKFDGDELDCDVQALARGETIAGAARDVASRAKAPNTLKAYPSRLEFDA